MVDDVLPAADAIAVSGRLKLGDRAPRQGHEGIVAIDNVSSVGNGGEGGGQIWRGLPWWWRVEDAGQPLLTLMQAH